MANEQSKRLSYLLRHAPEKAGLTLDSQGWCSVKDLEEKAGFDICELIQIVAEDEKKRYSFSSDSRYIRAVQGHSTPAVSIKFKSVIPPPILYHGADTDALPSILKHGLKPMKRHHVHLSPDVETAKVVGARRRNFTVLVIDAKTMLQNGYKFYISENGVYLVDAVPPPFIKATI